MNSTAVKFSLSIILLLLGFYMGTSYTQIKFGMTRPAITQPDVPLSALLEQGNAPISDENFKCKLDGNKTVGNVIADITLNLLNDREKRFTYSCWTNPDTGKTSCALEAKCGLLQDSGCARTLLDFEADKSKKIIPQSFACRTNGQSGGQ